MGFSHTCSIDVSEPLYVGNVKEAYQSTTKVNYIHQMLKHNDSVQGQLSYLALQGGYDIDSAIVFNILYAAYKLRKLRRAHLLRLHHCLKEPFFRPKLQQVHHLSESLVRGVCRNIKFTSLRDASVNFAIPNFGQLLHTQIEDYWGHEGS
jgi:hypothetical protein